MIQNRRLQWPNNTRNPDALKINTNPLHLLWKFGQRIWKMYAPSHPTSTLIISVSDFSYPFNKQTHSFSTQFIWAFIFHEMCIPIYWRNHMRQLYRTETLSILLLVIRAPFEIPWDSLPSVVSGIHILNKILPSWCLHFYLTSWQ